MRRRLFVLALGLAAVAVAFAFARSRDSASPAPELAPSSVSLIGDSLNIGVEPYLVTELHDWAIDSDDAVGRSTETGIAHLRVRGSALGRYVVVSLGTNDPRDTAATFRAHVAEALRLAGTRCVVWATIDRDGDAYEPFNDALRAEAATAKNLRLVEWTAMLDAHPDWLAADGIHATAVGYRARAAAIVTAMGECPGSA